MISGATGYFRFSAAACLLLVSGRAGHFLCFWQALPKFCPAVSARPERARPDAAPARFALFLRANSRPQKRPHRTVSGALLLSN